MRARACVGASDERTSQSDLMQDEGDGTRRRERRTYRHAACAGGNGAAAMDYRNARVALLLTTAVFEWGVLDIRARMRVGLDEIGVHS